MRLTSTQKQIYNTELVLGGSVNTICGTVLLDKLYNIDDMKRAINEVYRINDALRTRIHLEGNNISQSIKEFAEQKIEVLSFESKEEVHAYASQMARTPIDLYGNLCELKIIKSNKFCGVFYRLHHIISDGWTLNLIASQFYKILNGEPVEAFAYSKYIDEEVEYLQSKRAEKDKKYFIEQFDLVEEAAFFADTIANEKYSTRKTIVMDKSSSSPIIQYAEQEGVSAYVLFLTLISSYFSKVKNYIEKFYIGTTVLNRTNHIQRNTAGMFINVVPYLANIKIEQTFSENIKNTQEKLFSLLRHQKYNYTSILSEISKTSLFDIMLSYENSSIYGDDFESTWYNSGMQNENLHIHIDDRDSEGIFRLHYDYQIEKFTEEDINNLHQYLMTLLYDAIENPDKPLYELEYLTEEEKEKVISSFNNTEHTYNIPENTTLYSLFEKKSEENKDKVCIIANEEEIKFKDFKLFAERIDSKVRNITEEKSVIAVICERSFEMYGAVYGIIRGGNAYLPIDPNYPQDRIDYILENSGAKAVITQDKFCHLAGNTPCINATDVLNNKEEIIPTEILAEENDTAYVIYTSGSTGNPKGAKISHKSAINRILWMHDFYPLEENDVILQKTPYTFDVSVWELFWWGITGRTLCASKPDEHFLPAKILQETEKNKVTHLHFVPSVFDLFLTYLENNPQEQDKFNSVKYVFLSGEALTANHINRFYNIYDYNKVQLHNLYGPTECAVDVSYYACTPTDIDPVPIGKPIYNTQLHIVDKYMNPTPIGVTGELCIAGVNVGQGYLNNEELTNVKFIDNPFGSGKLYKTGDLAYWREDGNICYVGRNDFQVKINGQRIELGEIENAIVEIDGVVQCAVVVREQYICAFYTGAVTDAKDFRNILSTKLPRYMVPHVFTYLDSLPMTVSGKLDRKALPPIDFNSISTETEYVAPETEAEKALAEALSTVLNVERVSMLDNFFNIGGDSINAIYVVSELEDMHYSLQVADIMQSDTLKDIVLAMKSTSDEDNYDYGFIQFDATEIELNELKETHTDNIKDIYSLTPSQEGMYAQYYQNTDTKTYQLQNLSRISKEVDLEILSKSVELLSVRHQVLKSAFTVLKSTGAIKQVILENRKPTFTVISNDEIFSQEALDKIISDNIPKSLDLQKDSLFRVTIVDFTDARFMLMHAHHIILDGWCLPVLINDLQKYYGELHNNKSIETLTYEIETAVASETSYAQYANWIRKQNTDEVTAYWKNLLADNEPSHIFGKEKKDNSKNEDIISFRTPLNNGLSQSIEQFAKENKVSPNSVFECAFSIALQKFSSSDDVIFDKTISGRSIPLKNIENTVGPFINTVPVRIQTNENSTLAEVLKETQNQTINANTNGILSLADLYKQTGIDAKSIDSLFVFENYYTGDGSEISNGPLAPQLVSFDEQTEFNLTVTILKQNNGYAIRTSYAKDFYTEKEAESFVNGYISVLESSIDETKLIKDISVLTEEEKNTILYDFNNTKAEYSKDKCIHELFEEQVERTPDKIALVAVDKKVTYAELNEEANRIANSLVEKGIGKGNIVGLMLPRKSYLLSALFGILKTGAAYLPIDMELPEERIEYMCKDTNAKFVVSMDNIDSLLDSDNTSNPNVDMTNESLCYCIYTSGSTGNPKGVMAKHRNVVNYISRNEHNIFGKIVKEDFEAIVSISTCSFDIFVTETIATLVNGLRVVLADEQECRNQYALNRLLTREKGQFLQTTPTKLKALTKEPSQREFLKNVKAILLGGEAMEQSYLDELKELTNAKIYNIYGVTEVPIWSVFADTDTFTDAITIGKPIANTQVYIVDKYMNPVPIGIMGELCIAGDSVSMGYLNRPELTEEKFVDNPFGEGKLYKTGDHAYWRDDGNLVFIGRKDFQVKIRGLRIELGEIESVLQAVEGIERAVVVVRKDKEDRQLLCAFYTGEDFPAKDLRAILSTKLPKYMVPHIFTHLEEMPMTASGKANRNSLPEIDLSAISTETEYVAPKTKEEKALTESIETTLDIQEVSTLDNFFDLGGDSLKSIELVSELEDKGYTVNVKAIFEAKDIQSLAKELTVKEGNDERIEYSSILPATAAQMRIYTSQLISPDSVHYNILAAFKTEELDIDRLQKAVNELIVRHESLRTSFENRNGQIIQIINEPTTIEIEKLNSADTTLFNTPFDLSTASLLKVGCYDNTVVVVAHHIIVDGESMTVLCKELNELYMGRELPETVQYGEFAVTDNYTEENEKYWLKEFSEKTTELNLLTDYQRPEKQSFNGTNIQSTIDNELNRNILDKCKQLGITPYVYYMACYNILLSKYSGNEDICVGMPISGRSSKFLNTIGMFVNTVVLRTNTDGNKVVNALMQEIRENSISAIDNQMYPYNELVKKLGISSSNRNPLYDVMFAYQNEAIPVIVFGDKEVESVPVTLGGVKCDLNFNIVPTRDKTVVSVEYCTDLFKEETINKFIKAYASILTQCLDETKLIKDISVLTEEEKEKVISSFNNTEHTYNIPENTTLYSLFEAQAEKNSNKVCIIANEEEITFKDFKLFAERIDNKVRSITNENKSVIAVICERSFEMYGAVYGIIRGGNAYLPIDPNYPQDRIDYILSNSGAKAVIAQDKFCHLAGNVPCINATEILNSTEQPTKTEILANENDTAYVIYTSGSTGNPKGAKISHKSAINRILWMHDFYPLEENDVILQKTPYTFDVSVWELFWWGITGRTLCASKPDEHFLPAKILQETEKNEVTHLHFVPSVFDLFLTYLENNKEEQSKFNSVKYVFLSGETLTANHINRFYNIYDYNKVQLHNLYGPTECAVDVSYYACTPTDIDPVPIGKPIYNTQLYIVDKYMNPTPIGVTGELCIAGVNVGQGYLNNEQLTNEKFIDNPFGSGKLYKTGDLAYWRNDGQIIYVGRMDGQIKLNGQRVELGEIEKVISEVADVESVAIIIKENNGQDVLVAFCCGNPNAILQIISHCESKLPQYMVPAKFQFIPKMPLNQSGKLDRKALKNIDVVFDNTAIKEEPITNTEKIICGLFQDVLGIDFVGRNESFFTLGGTSLDMIAILSENGMQNISAADFIANPTPEKLAKFMESDTIVDSDGFYTLRNAFGSTQALILIPYAGGDASAFAALTKVLERIAPEMSVYYVDYLRSYEQCEIVANKIKELSKAKEINIYSHCAGTAVALQLINILEKEGVGVSNYITGGFIPSTNPPKRNGWNYTFKRSIQRKLIKAGAPIEKFSAESNYNMVEKFRKDTDFMTEYFYKRATPINAKTSVIISKTDIFTQNYAVAETMWRTFANNFDKLHYIDTNSHYFQTEKSEEVAQIIIDTLNK